MILLIAALAAAATAAGVVVVGVLFGRREARLERRLAGYERVDPDLSADESASLAPMQSAVDFTSRVAERTGYLERVETALERGDVPVRAAELIFYTLAFAIAAFLLIALLLGPVWGLVLGAIVLLLPIAYVSRAQGKRRRAFEHQLPDTLTLLASSLRSGFSFMQGLEAVAQEIGNPMRRELQRVFTEVRLGRSPEDSLGDAAARMESTDLAWTVMAVKIQREVGGNLAVLLDTVADTMQKRDRIRREISALTAEGRLSAIILGLLAPLAALGLFLVAPGYMDPLAKEPIGIAALIAGGVLAVVGFLWLRRLIDIEV